MTRSILIQTLTLGIFWTIFFGLQNQTIYKHTLGSISDNWHNENGQRYLVDKPYEALTNHNFIHWDADHYFNIRNNGYNIENAVDDRIFAFFPLFPFIWKISLCPPVGVFFLNYLFFSIAILILLKLFSKKEHYTTSLLISLVFPGLIIFVIPYTEATYMLAISIGVYGFVKNRYPIFFMGMFLAALTRPSFVFLLLSIIGSEIFFLPEHRNYKTILLNTIKRIAPLVLGTCLVSIIQYAAGSNSMFRFIQVQKYWDNVLSVPHDLRDWSHEGFAINLGVVFLIFIPCLFIFSKLYMQQLRLIKGTTNLSYTSAKSYLLIVSILYIIGNSLFIFLYRGGSLHCLFRFTISSPFFFIALLIAFEHIRNWTFKFRLISFFPLALLSLITLDRSDYSPIWNFSDFGIFVFIAAFACWLYQDLSSKLIYKSALMLLLFVNLVWTTYLFHTYIVCGWIFA